MREEFSSPAPLAGRAHLPPAVLILLATCLLIAAFVLLRLDQVCAALLLSAAIWTCLGFAASALERASIPANLASTLIESGKTGRKCSRLRWRGRLRSDPLKLPWGMRYDIDLDEVESSAGMTPVTGGLRLTALSGRIEQHPFAFPCVREIASRLWSTRCPSAILAIPGSFDQRAYLALQGIELQGSLRNTQLLRILDNHPGIDDLRPAGARFADGF